MNLESIRRVRAIESVSVYSRNAANAEAFARASDYGSFKVCKNHLFPFLLLSLFALN